jgi:predicted PurR-regulated permease PerM
MNHKFDPPTRPGGAEPERAAQRIARLVLAAMLVLLGLWILHRYLAALGWAAVLAIALWPLYRRLVRALQGRGQRVLAPLVLTLSIGLVFIVPFV